MEQFHEKNNENENPTEGQDEISAKRKINTGCQLQLLQIEPQNCVKKTYNSTYCHEWISKTMQYKCGVSELAQNDGTTQGTSLDSLDLSSLNITSVSQNKVPECTGEKFISQRHNTLKCLQLRRAIVFQCKSGLLFKTDIYLIMYFSLHSTLFYRCIPNKKIGTYFTHS